jgi:uncharacterized membrane protein YdbT with pleckstrin-like domain
MNYVRKVLQPGERVAYSTGPHWLVYGWAIFLAALAVALAILSQFIDPTFTLIPLIAAAVIAAAALIAWIPAFLVRTTTELAVTSRRIIYKTGLVRRHTVEISLDKVESVNVDQTVLGRALGYGSVTIHGTGSRLEPLRDITDPITFRNHVTAG